MTSTNVPETRPSRSKTVRHLLIFQVKLWLEGFKDVVLMPLSFGAALIDLVFRGGAMYSVMRMGARFERWVHLYGALEDVSSAEGETDSSDSLDALLNDAADQIERRGSKGGTSQGDRGTRT